ncbi:MAG: HAMP domain-containing protein [Azonexus sp.]|nr:HAMP domain-containing protein [Azonexus sp.]MCK6411773.1 HAMP domain-containing protein [Azonexus sp.]
MRILEPVVHLIGQLSFRNKLRVTALVFGLPLLAATTALLLAINARVSGLQQENAALGLQLPAATLFASLSQHAALIAAVEEGGTSLEGLLAARRQRVSDDLQAFNRGLAAFESAPAERRAYWQSLGEELARGQVLDSSALLQTLHADLDVLNERAGLLSDGDAASSRLLDVLTGHLPGLLASTGQVAQIGAVVLTKKSVRGSRRSDLTLHRGNFDALVLWSMESLRKVGQVRPELAAALDLAAGRLNTAFSPLQEAITIKMLDTTDFAMEPGEFLALTDRSFAETLAVGGGLSEVGQQMLAQRLDVLTLQRDIVLAAIVLTLLLVLAGFIAAYISIMRGLNGLSDAVETMAAGNLDARVEVRSRDELGEVGLRFNEMASRLAEQTGELREKTSEINGMLQNLPQGILTMGNSARIEGEYSRHLEGILEQQALAGSAVLDLLGAHRALDADLRARVEATIAACVGEDPMNFEFNAHQLPTELVYRLADGREKVLELLWAPICDADETVVERLLLCIRDVSEMRKLAAEAEHQKRELLMIGQILKVSQEKFHAFIEGSRAFLAENRELLHAARHADGELVATLFRNMHTIKGNARTFGLLQLTHIVHVAEQAYDSLRQPGGAASFDQKSLLAQLDEVAARVDEYAQLNEVTLGRKGPGRRAGAEKYLMVEREHFDSLRYSLDAYDLLACSRETVVALLAELRQELALVGCESIRNVLDSVFASLPSLAEELGKAPPQLLLADHGWHVRNQLADLLRNVCMHLYRNALDHGIETPAERLAAGKPAAGRIELHLACDGDRFHLRLRDDGRGLALAKIRARAGEKGWSEQAGGDDAHVANLIFAPGFSTAEQLTEVSGRGVGMDAVLSFIKREQGEIHLRLTGGSEGDAYRPFETLIQLPAQLAVQAAPSQHLKHAARSPAPAPAPASVAATTWLVPGLGADLAGNLGAVGG